MKSTTKTILIAIITLLALGATVLFVVTASPEKLGNVPVINNYLQQRVDDAFKPVDCPNAPRTFPAGAYTGPLYDMHVHMAAIPDGPVGSSVDPGEGLV